MAATAAQIAQIRRMIAEPTTATYSDADITAYIERYPHIDQFGESPLDAYGEANADWTATYDLNAAAGDLLEEKAAAVALKFDFSANGGQYTQSQQYEQLMKLCRHHRARRMPTTSLLVKSPEETRFDEGWIGNLPESD